jgi:hypothetical protein
MLHMPCARDIGVGHHYRLGVERLSSAVEADHLTCLLASAIVGMS